MRRPRRLRLLERLPQPRLVGEGGIADDTPQKPLKVPRLVRNGSPLPPGWIAPAMISILVQRLMIRGQFCNSHRGAYDKRGICMEEGTYAG